MVHHNRQMLQHNSNYINAICDVTCNEVLITLVNLCDKRVSVCHGFDGPVKNNGLPFPSQYDLVAVTKVRRECFEDGKKKQISAPSDVSFQVFHENPFNFPFECNQRRRMTFRMDNVTLH